MKAEQFSIYLDYLKLLVRQPSVVGSEEPFFRLLQRELEELDVHVERYHGLLVASKDAHHHVQKKHYISVHVDRHGLMCTGPNEFQYAAFIAQHRSEMQGDSVSEQTYKAIADRFEGKPVLAYQPWSGTYLGKGVIRHSYICERRENLVFEIDGLGHLNPGTPVAYTDRLTIEENRLAAQLDNVLNVALVLYLYACGYEGTAFFTAQEEAGRSWRFLLDWFHRFNLSTQELLVLDTSPYATFKDAELQQVVLRKKDANGVFNVEMVQHLEDSCKEVGINFSYKDEMIEKANLLLKPGEEQQSLGRTELGRIIQSSKGLINGATLQIPTTGYHTDEETASIDAVKSLFRLLMKII